MNIQIIEIYQPYRVMWMMRKYGRYSNFATITLVKGRASKRWNLPISLYNVPEHLESHLKRICEFKLINNKKENMEKHQFKPFDQVLVRDSVEDTWQPNIYASQRNNEDYPYVCISDRFAQCIPYNEETAHLIGTTKAWPEKPVEKKFHVWNNGQFNQWYTKEEFKHFIETAVINNKDITDFHVMMIK